ncbi:MAG: DUF2141 domain-containing protein [Cellvibrionaceae bacterium]
MKINTIITTAILSLAANLSHAGNLTFTIKQVKSDQGSIYLKLYKGKANYKADKAHAAHQVPAKTGDISIGFDELPSDDYAIRYYHDENADGKLQKNLFGIPTEGYGFSSNARGNFGPPSFEKMKVTVDDTDIHDTSTIKY